jgi:hypothetical protein
MSHKTRVLQLLMLVSVISIALVVLLLVGAINLLFVDRDTLSPTEKIRQRTEAVLQAAKYPRPTNSLTPVPLEFDACGNWLPGVLRRNNNQYSIVIMGVWGDGASPIPGGTGSITAAVQVVFPDNTRLEMQYYAYTLYLCRLIPDGGEHELF